MDKPVVQSSLSVWIPDTACCVCSWRLCQMSLKSVHQ
jgi:hypothetical protein